MSTDIILNISHLNKKYGKKQVLEDIDIEFQAGKIVSVIGENGCGKSTLFKIILGLAKPSYGNVDLKSHFANGMVETPAFFPHFTGKENLKIFLYKKIIDEDKLSDLANKFNMSDDLDTVVSKYSLGMKQKLAIIYIILSDADIMLFDEPTNALDQNALTVFKNAMLTEKANGKLVLIASHNINFINSFSDEIYEIQYGKLTKTEFRDNAGKSYLFVFADINKAIETAKKENFDFVVLREEFFIIKNWYLTFDQLLSFFVQCDIKLFFELNDISEISEQVGGYLYALRDL